MIRTSETNKNCFLCCVVARSPIVLARIDRMSMIQAFADRVSLDDLITHDEVEGFSKMRRFESEVSVNISERMID